MGKNYNSSRLVNGLSVDASGNVGVNGTPSGTYKFEVTGTSKFSSRINLNASSGFAEIYAKGASSTTGMYLFDNGTESGIWKVDSGYMAFATTNTERMRITSSGNVGIGTTTPSSLLSLSATQPDLGITYTSSASYGRLIFNESGTFKASFQFVGSTFGDSSRRNAIEIYNESAGPVNFVTSGVERMRITSIGNVGIGTTPSSWDTAAFKGLQIANSNVFVMGRVDAASQLQIGTNTYYNADGNWKFIQNGYASRYIQNAGVHSWEYSNASGIAGNNVTFNEAMRISSAGDVEVKGGAIRANGGYFRLANSTGTTAYGYFLPKALWLGSGTDQSVSIAGEGGSGVSFFTNGQTTERMTITTGGNVYLGNGFGQGFHRINRVVAQGNGVLTVSGYDGSNEDTAIFYSVDAAGYSTGATALRVGRNTTTSRSINAGGTINASGADYAEYMFKVNSNIIINKGDIVGVDQNGLLTNIFADAKSFVIKSTDPSYVGGDIWANENVIGKCPIHMEGQTQEEFDVIMAEYNIKIEAERAKVDRIAFSGQVPCNVSNAQVGDYIIPIELENGKISGQAVSNPTFEQYQVSVGKVWKIMEDGRAWVAVKIG